MATKKLKAVVKPVFNPQESYQWQAEDVFEITGQELDIINRTVQAHMNTPEGQRATYLVRSAEILQKLIKHGVEEGVITPVPKNTDKAKATETASEQK